MNFLRNLFSPGLCAGVALVIALSTATALSLETVGFYADGVAVLANDVILDVITQKNSRSRQDGIAKNEQNESADAAPSPADVKTLEETAAALMREEKYQEADRIYSRLLRLTLDQPEQAVRFAFARWHLRQGYEAQASMLRVFRSGNASVGNAELMKKALADAYDEKNVIRSIRREFPDPADSPALDNLERHWDEVCQKVRRFEEEKDAAGLGKYTGALLGGGPLRAYHALWRGYALIYQGNPDAAAGELDLALESNPDRQSEADAIAGLRLVRELRRSALSNDLLNRISEAVSGVSSAVSEQISEDYATVGGTLDKAEQAVRDHDFAAAAAALGSLRSASLPAEQRARYLYLLAETQWDGGEFARANQGYTAARVMSADPYIQSGALIKMAEYASMNGRREDAAAHAERSAAILPNQGWKQRQVGSFFIGLGSPEQGIAYLERSLDLSDSLESDAAAYADLAEAYKRIGERDKYLKAANDYIGTVKEIGASASPGQNGLVSYYQGEILAAGGKPDEAYAAYERAEQLLPDKYRRAEILMNMAEYQAKRDNAKEAVRLAEQSAELLPDQPWKLRQAGEMLLRLGERDKGFSLLRQALESSASPADRAASLSALAEGGRSVGDDKSMLRYAREYSALEAANADALTDAEKGLSLFYRGEVFLAEGKLEEAYGSYERAADLVADNYRKSDIYMKMAEIRARRGEREQAAALAEKSAETLPDGWKLRQVGDFLVRLDMPDKALDYFARYAKTGSSPDDQASVFATMADAYKGQGNQERYLHFAREYMAAASAPGRTPTNASKGLAAFFQAEIHAAEDDPDAAFKSYETASGLLEDKARLSETFMKMAEYRANRGEKEQAAALAEKSAETQPEPWRLQQTGDFLMRLGMPDRAMRYFERFSSGQTASAADKMGIYRTMAETYRDQGNQERYLHYAGEYVGATTADGRIPSSGEEGLAAFYRGEIHASRNETDAAYAAYERAAPRLEDKAKQSDAFMKMAGMQAERGDREAAAALAEKSAESLPDPWKQRQVGDFLLRLGMPDKAFDYLRRGVQATSSPEGEASVYKTMADVYDNAGDRDQYLRFAGEYVKAVTADGRVPSSAEAGLAAFYQGEIHASRNEPDQAYAAYERASRLVADKGRLAGIYMKMAEYQAGHGDKKLAAELAMQSASTLPEEWKLREVGSFLMNQGMPDKALAFFERYGDRTASMESRASAYAAMAEIYKNQGDAERYRQFAEKYIEAATNAGRVPTQAEKGLADFYRGEILAARNEPEQAYQAYESAAKRLEDNARLSEAYMRMAELRRESGDKEEAAALAEKASAALPDQAWKTLQVGDFLLGLDMQDKAAEYFNRVLSQNPSPRDKAAAYRAMAESYKKREDRERYLQYASEFVAVASSGGYKPTREEQALAAYYQGEILAGRNDADGAYRAYDRAAELTRDKFLLADLYMKMADYHAEKNNKDQAAAFAEKAARTLPDQDWKLQQVGELYNRLEMPEKALEYFAQVRQLTKSPKTRALTSSAMAEIYKKMNDTEKFLRHAGEYVAAVEAGDFSPSKEEDALRHFYQGEIDEAKEEPDRAYQAYEQVTRLSSDKYRLSDAYIRMARRQAVLGDKEKAIAYAERSRELLADQGWRVMEVGDVYSSLDLNDKAVEYYEEVVRLTPVAGNRAAAYTALAEVHKKLGDQKQYVHYARLYVEAMASRTGETSNNEKGLILFYRGESAAFEGNEDESYRLWDEAALLFDDKFRLSDIAMKQAEYQAKRKNMEKAAELAEKAAALLPDQAWRQKGAADFLADNDMPDKAVRYYEKNLALAKTPEARAAAYSDLAGVYKKMKNEEKYLDMAREYLSALWGKKGELTKAEKALQGFYLGEVLTAEGNPHQAYAAYLYASQFIEGDAYRLSDVLIILAKHNAKYGDGNLAAEQAVRAADLLPDKDWRVQEVVSLLGEVKHFAAAEAVAERAIEMNPAGNMRLYKILSNAYSGVKNKKKSLFFNARFIDLLTDKVAPEGALAPQADQEELWNARNQQTGESRLWGLDSYYFGKRWPSNGNYFLGMSHELFRYYKLPNGLGGKMYAQFGGTLKAHYSGQYQEFEDSGLRTWDSRPRLPDTAQLTLGVNINPFRGGFMGSVSVAAEYVFGVGRDMKNDFRLRFGCDTTVGANPKRSGKYWKYWKVYTTTVYSTRYNDITSSGDYRLGVTVANSRDSNLLVMPHVLLAHSYGGKSVNKGERWGFDVGAGVGVRKWFREDKYHTPRSYIDLHLYYHHALTHDRKSGPGFTLSTSF